MSASPPQADRADRSDRVSLVLLLASIALLLLVGLLRPTVASPPLGEDGWAPPALPWRPAAWTVVALQGLAYVLGAASLLRPLSPRTVRRSTRRPRADATVRGLSGARAVPGTPRALGGGLHVRWWHLLVLAVLVLLTAPYGTADHTNYAAYGRILAEGGNPWTVVPEDFGGGTDPVTSLVQPPWQDAPSVYGPVGTWLMGLAGLVGGDSMRQIVWVWQVVVVAAWLGTRALLVRLGATRDAVDRWWTLNPLVLGAGVLGAHLDTIAVAAMVAALAAGLARRPLLAGLLTGLAASTKITAGVVALALAVGWLATADGPLAQRVRARGRDLALLAAGTLAVLVPLYLLAGADAIRQVRESGGGVSYASPWRAVYTALDLALPELVARNLTIWLGAAGCLALALALWGVTTALERWPVPRALLVLTTAYALGAAYVLPWYELMQWASLALVVGLLAAATTGALGEASRRPLRALVAVLVLRGTVLALAYVPGRIRLPQDVETVTLGFRFVASPLATLATWVAIVILWRRARDRAARPARDQAPARG